MTKTKKPAAMVYLKATEVVRETEKAVLLRRWIGMGCDPKTNARQHWFPKAVLEKKYFNAAKSGPGLPTVPGDYWLCKTWFVGKEELWSWVQG